MTRTPTDARACALPRNRAHPPIWRTAALLMVLVIVRQPWNSVTVIESGLPEGICQGMAMRMNFDLQQLGIVDRRAECREEW